MMQITQAIFGTAFLAGAINLAVSIVVPPILPPPIAVHSLTYQDGFITQDRTVSTEGPFAAIWRAQIKDADSGEVVPGCEGSGSWFYPSGRAQPVFPLAEWVGSRNCVLPPGRYRAVATYEGGTFRTVARGEPFTITD